MLSLSGFELYSRWVPCFVDGKTRKIAIQLVSQQCCKTSCRVFVARFTTPLTFCVPLSIQRHFGQND